MGLHPLMSEKNLDELQHVEDELKEFYAIGEIGIDLYWDKSYLKQHLCL
jgi:TatD DNase family protein